jgi:hypothetical protein
LGKIISRTEKSTKYKTSLPGAAAGEYIIVVFKTDFEKKKNVQETITTIFENNLWKTIDYTIK